MFFPFYNDLCQNAMFDLMFYMNIHPSFPHQRYTSCIVIVRKAWKFSSLFQGSRKLWGFHSTGAEDSSFMGYETVIWWVVPDTRQELLS